MDPIITTIIPAYNSEDYIKRCVDSLTSQDFKDVEIIIVDDGSEDKTLEIANACAAKDDRIKVLHTNNNGVSNARNRGLNNAKGEYVNFVDSDDVVAPGYYSKLLEAARSNNAQIAQCGFEYLYEDGTTKIDDNKCVGVISGTDKILAKHYEGMIGGITMALWDKLFKRELIEDIRFDTCLTLYEDVDFMYRVLKLTDKVVAIEDRLYQYFQREDSAMRTDKNPLQCFRVYERILVDLDYEEARKLLALRETKQALWFMHDADKENFTKLRNYAIKNRRIIKGTAEADGRMMNKLFALKYAPGIYYKMLKGKAEK